jgi:hypothetical protein
MSEFSIDQILAALNAHKIRATYTAVADLMGTQARNVAAEYLGVRRPEASWVVSKSNGLPTDYSENDYHPELQSNSRMIEDSGDLAELVRINGRLEQLLGM